MTKRPLLGVLLVVALVADGCGTSCPEIRELRQAFDARARTSRGPDARLALPFALLDRVIAGQLARRAPLPIDLPTAKLGIPLSLSLVVERVTTHSAPAERLGMTLALSLVDPRGGQRMFELEVDTAIAPKLVFSSGRPELELLLRPQDLGAVRPRATPETIRILGRWLRENLPPIARALATDAVVEAVAQESLDLIASDIWPHAKDRLLGSGPLVDTRFALPDLPIRELALSSHDNTLIALITTDLPEAEPLGSAFDRVGERLVLRLSGGTAMGLVNRAMARGEVPSRFDAAGKPDKDGAWEARVGWRGGSSPLVVHLWRTRDACKNAEVAARLKLALEGESVHVAVDDGRLTSLRGPAFAEAFAWLEALFGDAMAFTFDTAAFMRFEAGADQVQLRLARVALSDDDLVLDLELGIASR